MLPINRNAEGTNFNIQNTPLDISMNSIRIASTTDSDTKIIFNIAVN